MMHTVYVETSVISYLTAPLSRDLVIAAHQQITHAWWDHRRTRFKLYASQLVLTEASKGDESAAKKRLDVLQEISLLELKTEATNLADIFIRQKTISKRMSEDMLHIAIATVHGLDYLLTWNCKHIANAEIHKKIGKICIKAGYEMPTICTPEELMGE
jgi:hypothetical protein